MSNLPLPVNYWHFEDLDPAPGTGVVTTDPVGHLTAQIDRYKPQPGHWSGYGLHFGERDGAKDVKVVGRDTTDIPPPWSLAVWVKREPGAPAASATLLSSNQYGIKLEQYSRKGRIGITKYGARDGDWVFDKGVSPPLDTWVHLVLMGTGSETRYYLDGQYKETLRQSVMLPRTWLGSTQGRVDYLAGCIDDLRLYAEALTDEQVEEIFRLAPPHLRVTEVDAAGGEWGIPRNGSKDLGLIAHGDTRAVTFRIRNSGRGRLDYRVGIADGSGQFVLAAPGTPTSGQLAADAATEFRLTFTSLHSQQVSARVTITSNDPCFPDYSFTLWAAGDEPGNPIPELKDSRGNVREAYALLSEQHHFPKTAVGQAVVETLTLTNRDDTVMTLTGPPVVVAGTKADFVVGPVGTASIPPRKSMTFTLTFAPKTPGDKRATLQIVCNGKEYEYYFKGTASPA